MEASTDTGLFSAWGLGHYPSGSLPVFQLARSQIRSFTENVAYSLLT